MGTEPALGDSTLYRTLGSKEENLSQGLPMKKQSSKKRLKNSTATRAKVIKASRSNTSNLMKTILRGTNPLRAALIAILILLGVAIGVDAANAQGQGVPVISVDTVRADLDMCIGISQEIHAIPPTIYSQMGTVGLLAQRKATIEAREVELSIIRTGGGNVFRVGRYAPVSEAELVVEIALLTDQVRTQERAIGEYLAKEMACRMSCDAYLVQTNQSDSAVLEGLCSPNTTEARGIVQSLRASAPLEIAAADVSGRIDNAQVTQFVGTDGNPLILSMGGPRRFSDNRSTGFEPAGSVEMVYHRTTATLRSIFSVTPANLSALDERDVRGGRKEIADMNFNGVNLCAISNTVQRLSTQPGGFGCFALNIELEFPQHEQGDWSQFELLVTLTRIPFR